MNSSKVFDMHCDTLLALMGDKEAGVSCSLRKNGHHIDLERMKEGNYLLQCFAVFVDLDDIKDPLNRAMKVIDMYYSELDKNKDMIAPVFSFSDIEKNCREGRMSALLTGEEGEICVGSPEILRDYYRMGLRMMTLTWNHENQLAYPNSIVYNGDGSCTFAADEKNGLKKKGFEFLEEMERLHMVIDVSHLSDAGFWDVYNNTKRPFAASHSNARAVCPHVRNLTDDMLRAMANRGCVAGLNFCGAFLDSRGNGRGSCQSRIEDMVRHVKHVADVGGMELPALGSDFDGIGGELELSDASGLGRLYDALLKAGFKESEADKIFCGNAMRFFGECLD